MVSLFPKVSDGVVVASSIGTEGYVDQGSDPAGALCELPPVISPRKVLEMGVLHNRVYLEEP